MIERNDYVITPLCELGKGKLISGEADFQAAARLGHGFKSTDNRLQFNNKRIVYLCR